MKKVVCICYVFLSILACKNEEKKVDFKKNKYPSDIVSSLEKWKILLGDGTHIDSLINYKKDDFFYAEQDSSKDGVVFKTPNSGITSKTSKNTRTELHQKKYWPPEEGGRLNATLKVKHVSTTGDATVASAFSVVIGQIHSDDGHENEPLKIYYKKFPGHTKGSVFWNYEINTKGNNSGRWDFSTAVWGYDWSVVGKDANTNPIEPKNGIELGEEFSYEVNVVDGEMHLTFSSLNHKTVRFTKSLIKSEFASKSDIPKQVIDNYASRRAISEEKENAYSKELQYFKAGAYNQANGKSTKSKIYNGDILKQYKNGSYAEVWFKEIDLSKGIKIIKN
ncbi:polysaccharide lyase family 7 protein [Polaribacter marinivivus]|uniref:polysaccharide lyase family 7 protein n=1 Tax=Polaribacter marinivivus TaxID=1524260 RepID=UPI003D339B49